MSSRWYPRFVRGNPQLRIFLPDFWMVLKKPDVPLQKNKILFQIPVQMTKYDVKNYLEKIYKIPVIDVQTRVVTGKIKRAKSKPYLIKEDDYREAIVDLPKHVQFEYPDLFAGGRVTFEDELEKIRKQFEFTKKQANRKLYENNRHNVPDWFGL